MSSFRQQCGRAGRLGLDTQGEAYLILPSQQQSRVNSSSSSSRGTGTSTSTSGGVTATSTAEELCKKLMCSEIEPLTSNLHQGAGGGLEKLLLEMICCGRLLNTKHIYEFIQCTLMSIQHPAHLVCI